ncbi:MAG: peptidoglycan DD-metalloendopeptidase family protein [Proteobacteria bacterium]|nr:peptidoglycan DD-metalloendopeptidase family protein [Pseudomonadota bacterium]
MRSAAALALLSCLAANALAAPSHHDPAPASSEAEATLRYEAARAADARDKAQAASGKARAEEQLQNLRGELDALARQQREAVDARTDASKALRAADGSVGQAVRELHDTQAAITAQQSKLADLQAQQSALAKKLTRQRAQLAALVRSAYALGGDEQLKLLLAQDRVVDLARALQYHRYLEVDRLRRIHDLTAQMQTLADLSKQVDAQRASLTAAQQQQAQRLAAVQAQRAQRGKLLADLDAGYKDRAARMQAMGRDADALGNLVNRLTVVMQRAPPLPPPPPPRPVHVAPVSTHHPQAVVASVVPSHATPPAMVAGVTPRPPPVALPFTGTPGHFAWPLAGPVLAGFGGDNHGLLIAGSAGEEVHAVADGRVAFADWLKGYGLLLIVDHGHGVMSLYANNDALLKNSGDVVRAGEAVATVGSSGGQGRNALYFEIRQNGKAVDPRLWLRAR